MMERCLPGGSGGHIPRMTRQRLFAVGLTLLLLVYPVLPAAAQTSPVQIAPEPGVAPEAVLDVQRAVELSLEFFLREYGLDLTRQVRVVLVPDRAGYIAALIREFRVDQAEADRRARTTTGWTSGATILMTVTANSARTFRMTLTAHELVHQLQMQVTAPANPWRLYWMAEGIADAVAARIVESGGYAAAGSYQTRWVEVMRRATRRPDLQELATEAGWFVSLDRNGSGTTYALAALAGHSLMERHGHPAILNYFRALAGTNGGTAAFQRTFNQTLDAFLEEFRRSLSNQLGASLASAA